MRLKAIRIFYILIFISSKFLYAQEITQHREQDPSEPVVVEPKVEEPRVTLPEVEEPKEDEYDDLSF